MINMINYLKPQNTEKIGYNFVFVIIFSIAAFLPDLILRMVYDLPIYFESLFFGGVLLFGLLLSFANSFVVFFFIAIIFFMQLIQLNYLSYFGTPLEASNLMNIFLIYVIHGSIRHYCFCCMDYVYMFSKNIK